MRQIGVARARTDGEQPPGAAAERDGWDGGNGASVVARKIGQSISYMLQHLDQSMQVATLAGVVNVSPSHYAALFKRWTGCPPIDYFIHLRMYRACGLLESTSLNVQEVAAALGYEDPFYFSRVFKAVNRVAPSEYRALPRELRDSVKKGALPPLAVMPAHANGNGVNGSRGPGQPTNGHAQPRLQPVSRPVLEPLNSNH